MRSPMGPAARMKTTRPIRRKQNQAIALMMQNGTKIGALANFSQQKVKLLNLLVKLNLILTLVTSTICLRMLTIGPLLGIPPTQPYLVTPLSNH